MVLGIRERTGRSVTPKTDRTAVKRMQEGLFENNKNSTHACCKSFHYLCKTLSLRLKHTLRCTSALIQKRSLLLGSWDLHKIKALRVGFGGGGGGGAREVGS